MSKLPSMPFYPADFFADTAHISGEAAGVYLVLLGHAWLRGGTLPNDGRAWARLARVSHQRWNSIRTEIEPFWKLGEDGLFRQKRQFEDYQNVLSKVGTCSQNGIKGNQKRWGQKHLNFNGTHIANGIALRQNRDHIPESELKEDSYLVEKGRKEASPSVNGQVFVKEDTEQWKAWAAHYRKSSGTGPPKTWSEADRTAVGWWFPSEWPPKMSPPLRSV